MAQVFHVAPSKLLELKWVHPVAAQPLATAPVAPKMKKRISQQIPSKHVLL